ncbi:hypothetical protein ACQ4PT_047884 [Festuca glaucescens]
MAEDEIGHWVSKDRFAAKRLHALAVDLDGPKRRIIAEQSAFRALLDVSLFNIPNALIDFVASHTSPGLREFKFHKKRIVFTKEMIVYMDHLDFPPNQHTINYSIPRVCFVTSNDFKFIVLNDADRKILNNKTIFGRRPFLDLSNTPYGVAAFVNHHHVEEPVEQPIEEPEVNPSASLNEWLVFPSSQDLEVPAAYKHLYKKHWTIYGADVDTTLKKFGVGLKQMQSQRMAALLIDIDAAMKEGDGPSVHFPTGGGVEDETMDAADVHEDEGTANQADEETPEADSEGTENDEVVVEANAADMDTHTLVVDMPQSAVLLDSSTGGADVGEQVAINSPDPDEVVVSESLQHITIPAEEITPPTDVASVVKLDDAYVVTKDASTGAKTVEKKTRYKRAAKGELSPPLLKKIKVSQDVVRKYEKYVSHGRKFKWKKKNEEPKQFLKFGRFFCSYKSFHGALRPRQYMSNDVMAIWTEKFNHAAKASVKKNPRNHKKYAFSPYLAEKLAVETSTFDPASVMKEFKLACSKFKVLKDDMFSNFVRTANESKVSWVDFGKFKQITPDHPQQDTLFDCGFYSILYMEHFNGKVMSNFENDAILDFRRVLAASLIDNRDNQSEDVDLIMNEDLQQE